ncbi:hypothetical protein CN995_29960 [Bacillus cereus]|uniref:lasso peptide biosynthesis B2 protein n=1 Tax=Bacillus cereus TaxID=1396 RepID=UPI000BED50A3|nr:lasso peptide biosynthesis B2 protein [Bacillus cereus]PED85255.1 hypothetical protein CON43_29580 [Bacillus cereus]PES12936.1 hypothetical protein CN501_16225 [Bacillus cereus]PEW55135.1 hypothetical protein CN443_24290 [Bacillus cereus]PGO90286.1 hypothetical protein CN995_29960 [Bacillus cereus]PGT31933.1 hypothetical protein COD06_25360 [Bacillus cereus]
MKIVLSWIHSFILIITAIIFLITVWALLKVFGIKILKWRLKNARNSSTSLKKIYNTVWSTSQYLPIECKCIEIASTVKFIAALYFIDASVILGISNNPFTAHAWVKSGEYTYGLEGAGNFTVMGKF